MELFVQTALRFVIFVFVTAILLKIHIFWVVMPWQL